MRKIAVFALLALAACDAESPADDLTPSERYCEIQEECSTETFEGCMSWVDNPPPPYDSEECLPLWQEHVECIAETNTCAEASFGGPCQASLDAWRDCHG